jgi:hypothetical protein
MAYIGSPVQQVLSRPTSQSFNGDGSTTVFTLNRSVNVSEELEVFVSNVQQEPGVGKSYTANGTSLTFDEAPPSGTGNIYVIYRGLSEVTRVLEHHPNNPLAATTGTFSGNVGIGTTNPLEQLSVANSSGRASIFLASGGTNQGYISYFNSTQTLSLGNGAPTGTGVNGGQQLNILNGGNVGIGTNDPGAKLEVDRGSASFAAIFGAPQGSGRAVLFKDNHASPNRYNYLIGSQYNINNGFEITPSTAVGGTTFSNPAIAILETGKIGIGTNSPGRQLEITDGNSGKIRVSGPDGGMIECWNGSHGVYFGSGLLVTGTGNTQDSVIFVEGGGSQRYYTSGYERMRIDSSGNVGIGGAPSELLHIKNASGDAAVRIQGNTRTFNIQQNNYGLRFVDVDAGSAERMRIDASGKTFVTNDSNVSDNNNANLCVNHSVSTRGINLHTTGTGGSDRITFQNDNGTVGTINTSGSSTSYGTSSDYRLKENVVADWDATTRLKQLNPVRFNFIADADTTVDGFLAHEVQDIVPEAITGTHNGMRDEEYEVTPAVLDEGGNEVTPAMMGTRSVPDYQGIDQSKLVPLLVKTIQELEARITALENN